MYSTMKISHRGTSYAGPEYSYRDDAEAYAISKLENYPDTIARIEVFDDCSGHMVLSVTRDSLIDYHPMYTTHYPALPA